MMNAVVREVRMPKANLMRSNQAVIEAQQARLKEAIGKLASVGTRYALIDFSDHPNVGDSAIWLGELKLLSVLTRRRPDYVCTVESFDAAVLRRAAPQGPIFIHGGGNFGDIWPKHQRFRETILEEFKQRLVVQLPQSIKFTDSAAIKRCAAAIAAHGNFHLLVRDRASLAFAAEHFVCRTELVPDGAFALGPLQRPIKAQHPVFALLRTDVERAAYDRAPFESAQVVADDWLKDFPGRRAAAKRDAVICALMAGAWSKEGLRPFYYRALATARLNRGLAMLSQGKQVITDRLHAHILSTLLDIPHVALDNNYGKIFGYIDAWTKDYASVRVATTAQEALQALAQLPPR